MCDIFDQEICFKTCYSTANLKQRYPISADKQCPNMRLLFVFSKTFCNPPFDYVLKVHFLTSEMTYYAPCNANVKKTLNTFVVLAPALTLTFSTLIVFVLLK
jgi:hypothetical protein